MAFELKTIRDLNRLARAHGGGMGFFGNSIREANFWSGELDNWEKEGHKIQFSEYDLVQAIDEAFIQAAQKDILEAAVYGDSRNGRHDSDYVYQYIRDLAKKGKSLQSIKVFLKEYWEKKIAECMKQFKKEQLLDLKNEWAVALGLDEVTASFQVEASENQFQTDVEYFLTGNREITVDGAKKFLVDGEIEIQWGFDMELRSYGIKDIDVYLINKHLDLFYGESEDEMVLDYYTIDISDFNFKTKFTQVEKTSLKLGLIILEIDLDSKSIVAEFRI